MIQIPHCFDLARARAAAGRGGRAQSVSIQSGSILIVIGDLPADVEADSLKIDGSTDQPTAIASIEMRISPPDPDKDANREAVADEIQASSAGSSPTVPANRATSATPIA